MNTFSISLTCVFLMLSSVADAVPTTLASFTKVSGTIKEINVAVGDAVGSGDVVVVIEA